MVMCSCLVGHTNRNFSYESSVSRSKFRSNADLAMKASMLTKAAKRARMLLKEEDDEEAKPDEAGVVQEGNKVYFYCDVSRESTLALVRKLDLAKNYVLTNSLRHVLLFIHSEGGDLFAGLSAMSHISCSKVPIVCVADGFVASAATFMLLAGSERFAMEYSFVLMHQLSTEFWGKYVDLEDEFKNAERLMTLISEIYAKRTNLKKRTIGKILRKS